MGLKRSLCIAAVAALLACPPTSAMGATRNVKDPIVLSCWVYYNGVQEQQFDRLLQTFNDSVGQEEGIFVESHSMGSVFRL